MAVEARHFDLFPMQERDLVNSSHQRMLFPATNQHFYHLDSINTESGLTGNVCVRRKRCRDSLHAGENFPAANIVSHPPSMVGGENSLPQLQQHQFEIDAIISQHTKRIKLELQERQKQQANLIISATGEEAAKKLKEKDEQIQSMVKLNMILQDRVRSLYVENQLWRDVAVANEATTISLRTNLEHALALAKMDGAESMRAVAGEDESCCGSSDTRCAQSERRCRRCGEREACVLVLPCRHLCLCGGCGSGSHQPRACPVCDCSMNATLHVNM